MLLSTAGGGLKKRSIRSLIFGVPLNELVEILVSEVAIPFWHVISMTVDGTLSA